MIIATTESMAVSMPNMKFSTPNRISPAMPTAKPPAQRVMPDAVLMIADNTLHNAFPMSFNVILISSNFKLLLLLSCSDGEVGSSPFSFRLSVCPMFPCDVFRPRIGRFRFGGFSKVGIRGCKVCRTKYYLSLRGWRFFRATARRPDLAAPYNPGITFAPATKMTTDAVWNGGMGTLVHTHGEAERKRDKCGMAQRATGKF